MRAPLRPNRSLRLPPAKTNAEKVSWYASTTHCSPLVVEPSSRTSVGNATFTIVPSTLIAKTAMHSTANTLQRRSDAAPPETGSWVCMTCSVLVVGIDRRRAIGPAEHGGDTAGSRQSDM